MKVKLPEPQREQSHFCPPQESRSRTPTGRPAVRRRGPGSRPRRRGSRARGRADPDDRRPRGGRWRTGPASARARTSGRSDAAAEPPRRAARGVGRDQLDLEATGAERNQEDVDGNSPLTSTVPRGHGRALAEEIHPRRTC